LSLNTIMYFIMLESKVRIDHLTCHCFYEVVHEFGYRLDAGNQQMIRARVQAT